jgi:hypothetical protein
MALDTLKLKAARTFSGRASRQVNNGASQDSLDSRNENACASNGLASQHQPDNALNVPVISLSNVVQALDLSQFYVRVGVGFARSRWLPNWRPLLSTMWPSRSIARYIIGSVSFEVRSDRMPPRHEAALDQCR